MMGRTGSNVIPDMFIGVIVAVAVVLAMSYHVCILSLLQASNLICAYLHIHTCRHVLKSCRHIFGYHPSLVSQYISLNIVKISTYNNNDIQNLYSALHNLEEGYSKALVHFLNH